MICVRLNIKYPMWNNCKNDKWEFLGSSDPLTSLFYTDEFYLMDSSQLVSVLIHHFAGSSPKGYSMGWIKIH